MKLISGSHKETVKIGETIAKALRGGEVIFLSGVLGAGKTVLTNGIAKTLGIGKHLPSPTFNIFRLYDCVFPKSQQQGKFYHFDCYRLKKYCELKELGWEEITGDQNSVVVLEWPECISDKNLTKQTNKNFIAVNIGIDKNNKRIIETKAYK